MGGPPIWAPLFLHKLGELKIQMFKDSKIQRFPRHFRSYQKHYPVTPLTGVETNLNRHAHGCVVLSPLSPLVPFARGLENDPRQLTSKKNAKI